jgi:hypothetical protein
MKKYFLIITLITAGCVSQRSVDTEKEIILRTSPENPSLGLEIEFIRGKSFNHPSFAIWTEDLEGNYIETLYVTHYVAKGKYGHGEVEPGRWKNEPGELRRPATLPYWSHKRGIKAPDGLYIPSPETAVPDAITSATPVSNFTLNTATSYSGKRKFRILMEINQAWDSNRYWSNNKFPGNINYYGSLQPALVYAVTVDPYGENNEYYLNPIGHSHPTGKNGRLFTDLTTITTAKDIAYKIIVRLKNKN